MQRYQKLWQWVGLLLFGLGLMNWYVPLVGQAALTDISSFKKTNGYILVSPDVYNIKYPHLGAVKADNIENGRLTTKTTQISVTFTDTMSAANSSYSYTLNNVYFDVMKKDGTSLATSAPQIVGTGKTSYNFGDSGKTSVISVDLSDLANDFPIYVGVRYTPSPYGVNAAYQFGIFSSDSTVNATIKPTITGSLTSSDKVIKGTGTNVGDKITNSFDGTTTTVGADKTYTLNLSQALGDTTSVTVAESNTTGDRGTVESQVAQKALALKVAQADIAVGPNELTSTLSDADVLDWLTKQAGLTASFSDGSSTAGVTFKSTETDLAAKLAALTSGTTLPINVYAQVGDTKSSSQTLSVKKTAGTLSFGTLSPSIGFGTLAIPSKETMYQPTSHWDVNITDTRATGSPWYVYASATPLTSTSHTLKGDLVYQNGSEHAVLTKQSTLIASGQRGNTNTTAITSDWSPTKGIFLDVQPGVYSDRYQGTVNWSLQATPTE